jgi:predicted dehydrogenase
VSAVATKPRLGFLGVGWIGRSRLQAIERSGHAEIAAIADPALLDSVGSLDDLLRLGLDGIVIATPSTLHAAQAEAALRAGLAVFCQKPLGLNAAETARVVRAARAADRLLGVDLSYRSTAAARAVRGLVESGELGKVFGADLTFHNAYGPDKAWFYDPALSGGGCLIDLGIHLVDLALWTLGWPRVGRARAWLRGEPVEDYAVAELELTSGALVRIACSWNLHAGADAVIEATFHGTAGGAAFRNVGGSFYDFVAERYAAREREVLIEPPDEWFGRAAAEWAARLAAGERYDREIERVVEVAEVLDELYRSAAR